MSPSTKRSAPPSRRTPRPGHFEPWQEDAAKKFGVSLPIVAERFVPSDASRVEPLFAGRTLARYPLANLLGEQNCFLRAFEHPELPVPFLVEHLADAIGEARGWGPGRPPECEPVPTRAVSSRELRIVSAQAKRLAASFRAIGNSLQAALLWRDGEREYGERCEPFLSALDDIADVAAGNRWCLPQLTKREVKRGLERAIAEEMALHGLLSAYRDGLTSKVLRFAYESADLGGGADSTRVLRAMVREWAEPTILAKRSMRRAEFDRAINDARRMGEGSRSPRADPYSLFRQLVWARVPPQDATAETEEDVPF